MRSQSPNNQALLIGALDYFNELLAKSSDKFESTHPGVTSVLVNTAIPFNKAINNPRAYGASDATCHNKDGISCLWFDPYHPGVAIQKLVANAVAAEWTKTAQMS